MSDSPADDERSQLRLRQIRQLLTVDLDRGRLAALSADLLDRRRRRNGRRMMAAAVAAAGAVAVLVMWNRVPQAPPLAGAQKDGAAISPPVDREPRPLPGEREITLAAGPDQAGQGAERGLPDELADGPQAEDRWASYVRSPDTNLRLPNVSYAGYRYGERTAGRAPGRVVNVKQPPFGAVGDGVSDDTAPLQQAIASVEREGGVVYLPDGDYRISDVLFVHGSGTVVRGESRARTRLLFTRTLDETMGPSMAGPYSRWEWAGGLLWFSARGRQSRPPAAATRGARPNKSPDWARQGWPLGAPLARVIEPASRGDRSLVLADASRLRPGDLVFLVVPASETLLAAGWWRDTERGFLADRDRSGPQVVRWPVEVTRVDGNVAGLAQPLRFDVATAGAPEDGPGPFLQAIPAEDLIRDVGVEQLTLVMQRRRDWKSLQGVADPFGWNGPFFLNTLHGFVRQVTVVDGDLGVGMVASKNISLEEVELRSKGLPPDSAPHRAAALRAQSHDVLVDQLQMDPRWVGFRLEGSGFVLSRGRGRFEHMTGQAVDTVLTELTEIGPGLPAASGSLVSSGERVVGWNLRPATQTESPAAAPASTAVPRNLYQAQKQLRLSRPRPR